MIFSLQSTQEQFAKTIEFFRTELAGLRTGRASPSLLEGIRVECYGTMTPLHQVASIAAPEPYQLVVQVWDATIIPAVTQAIQKSDVGLNPSPEGQLIRVPIPALNEERRLALVKIAKQKAEVAKVGIRTHREEAMKLLRKALDEKTLSEDAVEASRKEIQRLVESVNGDIQRLLEKKEEEILTV